MLVLASVWWFADAVSVFRVLVLGSELRRGQGGLGRMSLGGGASGGLGPPSLGLCDHRLGVISLVSIDFRWSLSLQNGAEVYVRLMLVQPKLMFFQLKLGTCGH